VSVFSTIGRGLTLVLIATLAWGAMGDAYAQTAPAPAPTVAPLVPTAPDPTATLTAAEPDPTRDPASMLLENDDGYTGIVKLLLLLAGLTFIPALILSMTSFTRIVIVLSMLRQAVGIVQLPPGRIVVGLALFLTIFTMAPVFEQVWVKSIEPYDQGTMGEWEALQAAMEPMRTFMLKHTREDDLALFLDMSQAPRPKTAAEVSTVALVPAFMLSELKTAFQMGALLFLPFLAIDLVVASVLMSMGMMMLPPMTISLPLKIIVFVLVDGWGMVMHSLAASYGG
jgi:flagellar biosynthetic protein FliP